ncbi:glycoside hydrolase family 15 [Candidatus Woesearchaeota archaeon]|nr:MAG: glycoside hydrolase family 15 [Candidatus Woesearchaeota archaeon]
MKSMVKMSSKLKQKVKKLKKEVKRKELKLKKKKSKSKLQPVNYQQLIKHHLKILKNLQYKSGLFAASRKEVETGYDKAWLRDNFYTCLAFEVIGDWDTVESTYEAILKIFEKHEYKIDYAIQKKPEHPFQYIHPRYHPETFDEFWEEWGNKQNDSIGAILFKVGELVKLGRRILKTERDYKLIQKLVDYLKTLEYWHDPDSGMWEEDEEIHASSVGACVAGLEMVKDNIPQIDVPEWLISNGKRILRDMLPRESRSKFVDLALLSLIYPYNVVNPKERDEILTNIEYHLLKKRGVIRYKNDHYYNKNPDGYSEEAEWTFGLSWLAIIYQKLGKKGKAEKYLKKALATVTEIGEPELYFSNSPKFNENVPLSWAESMLIVALYYVNKKIVG